MTAASRPLSPLPTLRGNRAGSERSLPHRRSRGSLARGCAAAQPPPPPPPPSAPPSTTTELGPGREALLQSPQPGPPGAEQAGAGPSRSTSGSAHQVPMAAGMSTAAPARPNQSQTDTGAATRSPSRSRSDGPRRRPNAGTPHWHVRREASCIHYLTPVQCLEDRPRHTRAAAGPPHPAHRARRVVGASKVCLCVSRQVVVAGPLRVRILCRRRGRDPSVWPIRQGARCRRRVGRERTTGS